MWPCYYGIDTPNRDDLLAANNTIQEMNDFIGSDTLEFITLENLRAAVQLDGECCDACLTGTYPAPIPVTLGAVGSRW
jgi:amidophosphoribosyltransferase